MHADHHHHHNEKSSVALSSVLAGAFLTFSKLIVGLMTNSMGIISEAAHSALDFVAALMTYFAVRAGDKPADEQHPYGHGKIESVSALFETALLYITSFWIVYEAGHRLFFHQAEVEATWYSIAVVVISIIIDISRSRALYRVARKTNSQALEADALHFSTDIWSSAVVLIGLVFVRFGIFKADSIAAILVALIVLRVGWNLGKRTVDVLIDTAPEGLVEKVKETACKVDGVLSVERVRIRPVGAFAFVDMVVDVHRGLSLEKVYSVTKAVEKEIHALVPGADITIHPKPVSLEDETVTGRVQIAAANRRLAVHNILHHTRDGKRFLDFHLELDGALSIKQAHAVADELEEDIRCEIGDKIEINVHIEPARPEIVSGTGMPAEEEAGIRKFIEETAGGLKMIRNVHDIRASRSAEGLLITLHCIFEDDKLLSEVHNAADELEKRIKEKLPETRRVVVHTEPYNDPY
jgi:cation diffusion facilitator family transporter